MTGLLHAPARDAVPRRSGLALVIPLAASMLVACSEGSGALGPAGAHGEGGTAAGYAGAAGAAFGVPRPPPEVPLGVDAEGNHAPDEVGFQGGWSGEAGPGSTVELYYDDGDLCLRGETGQVIDGDYRTYWGAQATFAVCESEGAAQPAGACLSAGHLDEFVGVAFTLEGATLPGLSILRFDEQGRESGASLWLQAEGDVIALFERTTDPLDPSAPPASPARLESITLRAAGDTEGPAPFDFCMRNLRALFGEEWALAGMPDFIDEPGPGRQVDYVGANLVGAEFGEQNLPGVYATDYIYPSPADIALYAGMGMNVFRVPFRWERMQRTLNAELDATELSRLDAVIAAASEHGATVIIDPHNFARYEDDTSDEAEKLIGVDLSIEAFADFWAKIAREFAGDELVWFGLMNEPHDMETEVWLAAANAAIAAIRAEGADNLVLVPGNQWTGAHAWFESYYGTPNATALMGVVDPSNNFAFELHQYMDANYSGTANTCISETIGTEQVEPVTAWLRENGFRGFLGEFGGSDDPVCLGAVESLLGHLGANADVWLGWAVWASSQWNIQHNIRPTSAGDTLQLTVLKRHLTPP